MSWPFARRGDRASQQPDVSTLHVLPGDGTDGTGGPDAARDGGPVALMRDDPCTTSATSEAARRSAVWDAWPVDSRAFAEALAAAERFTEDEATLATAPAWSHRVDEAVHGMDWADPDAMDAWMQVHADSARPVLDEARLVAAWETLLDHQADLRGDMDDEAAAEAAAEADIDDGWP